MKEDKKPEVEDGSSDEDIKSTQEENEDGESEEVEDEEEPEKGQEEHETGDPPKESLPPTTYTSPKKPRPEEVEEHKLTHNCPLGRGVKRASEAELLIMPIGREKKRWSTQEPR